MALANFSIAQQMLTPAHRAFIREREPLGREQPSRERRTTERTFGPNGRRDGSKYTPLLKRPQSLNRQKADVSFLTATAPEAPPIDLKQSDRAAGPAALAARAAIAERVEARYQSGNAVAAKDAGRGASMEYEFPRLPSDTAEREWGFKQGQHVDPAVPAIHGYEARPLLFGWRPFRSSASAPDPVLEREPGLFNSRPLDEMFSGPFYGRYVGPEGNEAGPPLTPVDKAAYVHDADYHEIYRRYQYSEFEYGLSFANSVGLGNLPGAVNYFGWAGNATSLDPAMQLELAWADMKLIGGSWWNIGKGLGNNFYSGGAGQRTFFTDLAWAGAITVLYSSIAMFRLEMAAVGLGYQLLRGFAGLFNGLGHTIEGDVGKAVSWIGDAANWVLDVAARVISVGAMALFTGNVAVAGVAAGIVGGVIYVGGKIVEGIGKAVEWVGDRLGCFITEAVVRTSGEADDGPTLTFLRRFRDEYVARRPDGRRLLLNYLEVAPAIVTAIERRTENNAIWRSIRERWIDPALVAIEHDRKQDALGLYVEMVKELSATFGVADAYDGARHHWKRDPRLAII